MLVLSTLFMSQRCAEPSAVLLPHETRAEAAEYDNFPHAQTMASFPPAVHDLLNFDQLLNEQERDVRDRTRAYMVGHLSAV